MNGSIKERIIKKGKDKNGNTKENLKVYDVYYRYKDANTGVWRKTSKKGFRGRKEAENYLLRVNNEMLENKYVVPKKLTLREYLTSWLDTYAEPNLRPTTVDGYRRNIEGHIIPHLGNIELQNLTSNDIDKFYSKKQKDGRLDGKGGLSGKSVLYIHRVLSEALEHAVRSKIIQRNVAKDINNKPKVKKFHNEVYSKNNVIELIESVKGTYWEAAITLAGICGLRRGEVLGLKWSSVNLENKEIIVKQQLLPIKGQLVFTDPKSEESKRTIPIPDDVVQILNRVRENQSRQIEMLNGIYKDNDMVVCEDDGSLINPQNFSKRFKSLLKKYQLDHIRFHDLRHTYATLMIESGVDLKTTSNLLGHSSISITSDIYVKVVNDAKRRATEKFANNIFTKDQSLE